VHNQFAFVSVLTFQRPLLYQVVTGALRALLPRL
jgi:hypothetical protein